MSRYAGFHGVGEVVNYIQKERMENEVNSKGRTRIPEEVEDVRFHSRYF